jgi:hypothetical protein
MCLVEENAADAWKALIVNHGPQVRIAAEAIPMVRAMLTVDPMMRIGAAALLEHPWIRSGQQQPGRAVTVVPSSAPSVFADEELSNKACSSPQVLRSLAVASPVSISITSTKSVSPPAKTQVESRSQAVM